MKAMIEIDLPDGQKIPTSDDILRLTSPDWVASWWHIDDVLGQSKAWNDDEDSTITEDDAREVLRRVGKYHDCTEGINWDVIDCYINQIVNERATA